MRSLTQLSRSLALGFDGNPTNAGLANRQFRNLVARGLLEPTELRGGRRDAYFDDRGLCKAVIIFALIRTGLDAVTLTACTQTWKQASDPRLADLPTGIAGHVPPLAVDALLYDLQQNSPRRWIFQLIVRRPMEGDQRVFYADLLRDDQPAPSETDPRSLAGPYADRAVLRESMLDSDGSVMWTDRPPLQTWAVVRIPITELLIDVLANESEPC